MTAILLSLLGSGGSASPEVFVSGVSASAQVGFADPQGSQSFTVVGVSASAIIRPVTTQTTGQTEVFVTGVQASGAVGQVQAGSAEEGLPSGTILFFDRSSEDIVVPDGFSLYTEYQGESIVNFLIKGGGTNARTVGSPAPVTINSTNPVTSGLAGVHPSSPSFFTVGTSPGGWPVAVTSSATTNAQNGEHAHVVTLTGEATYPSDATFQGMEVPLIKASSARSVIPVGCVVFSASSSGFTNCSRKSWSVDVGVYSVASSVNAGRSQPTDVSPAFGLTTASAGSHSHRGTSSSQRPATGAGPLTFLNIVESTGSHVHPGGSFGFVGVWNQFKHLLPFVADSNTTVQSGMIVMFEGNQVPIGWGLCDGTNGTPDMVGFFLGYNNALSGTNQLVGRNVVGSSGPTETSPAPPPSAYGSTSIPVTIGATNWPHAHNGPSFQSDNRPLAGYAHTAKSVPHTHTVPNATVTMPSAYTPRHLTLIFIQKL